MQKYLLSKILLMNQIIVWSKRIQVMNPIKIALKPRVLMKRNHLDVEQNVNRKLNRPQLKYFRQNLVDNGHRKNLPIEKFQLLISYDNELILVDQQQIYAFRMKHFNFWSLKKWFFFWSKKPTDEHIYSSNDRVKKSLIKKSQWKDTDLGEMWAFIRLLPLVGVHRVKNETLDELWSMINGQTTFRAIMTNNRFKSLLRVCRFNNTTTREERLKVDKLAATRDLWTMFLARLQICYTSGGSLTVDEQLMPTGGRCNLSQYIPGKPGKYGMKIFWCCESDTVYPLNAGVYLGRRPGVPTSAKRTKL